MEFANSSEAGPSSVSFAVSTRVVSVPRHNPPGRGSPAAQMGLGLWMWGNRVASRHRARVQGQSAYENPRRIRCQMRSVRNR